MDNGSRMSREAHVRFCERLGVQLPGSTHLSMAILNIALLKELDVAHTTDMTFRVNRDRFSVLVHLNFLRAT